MNSIRLSEQRIAAWLGIFAILLIFIAPVISQSLEPVEPGQHAIAMEHTASTKRPASSSVMKRHASMDAHPSPAISVHPVHQHRSAERAEYDYPAAQAACPDQQMIGTIMPANGHSAHTPLHHAGMLMDSDFACGYCVLLIHLPMLLLLLAVLSWFNTRLSPAKIRPTSLDVSPLLRFTPSRPRAPPTLLKTCF